MKVFEQINNNHKKIDFISYFLISIIILANHLIVTNNAIRHDFLVNITFFIIGFLSFFFYILDNRSFFSVYKIFNVFNIIFFYLAAFHQYTTNTLFWNMKEFADYEYIFANILIIFYIVIINISMFCNRNIKNVKSKSKHKFIISSKYNLKTFCFYLLVIMSIYVTSLGNSSLLNMLNITFNFSVALMLAFTIICYKKKQYDSKKTAQKYILLEFLIFIIVFNPFTGRFSRFLLFGAYLLIFYAVFINCKLKSLLLSMFILGFGFIFPLFNVFKSGGDLFDLDLLNFDYFNFDFVDYDAYLMFLSTIRYTNEYGISYGNNIFSAIFSFIPRSVWHSKAEMTGEIVGIYLGSHFTNLSSPLIAEFYLSFGSIGVILFCFLFSSVLFYINKNLYKSNYWFLINATLCGIMILFLRGAILPTFNYIYFELLGLFLIKLSKCF